MALAAGNGVDLIRGTFVPTESSNYTINLPRSVSKYLYLIDMTDADKSTLLSSGVNGNRTYAIYGAYPQPQIDGSGPNDNYMSVRINPSTGALSAVSTTGISGIDDTSITISCGPVSSTGATYLLLRYTYNYTIIPLD